MAPPKSEGLGALAGATEAGVFGRRGWRNTTAAEPAAQGLSAAAELSISLHRRHLSETQRSMVAGQIANMERGGDRHQQSKGEISPLTVSTDKAAA